MASRREIRPRLTAVAQAAVVLASVALAGCGGPALVELPDEPAQPLSAVGGSFFAGDNLWTTPTPADADIDPLSAGYVTQMTTQEPVVTLRQFAVKVYVAEAGSPRYSITPTAPRTPPGFVIDGVPIPPQVTIDPADNGHLAILDSSTDCVYELYAPAREGDGWTADWVNALPADGDGVFADGLSARASGFASTAGLIWPDELRSGTIPHALVFAYPFTEVGGAVLPATRSDGRTEGPTALPIGSRLRLDPTLDLGGLGLSPAELTIATALQDYGMILGDTSNGFTVYAVHPDSFPADPYTSTWGGDDDSYASLKNIPFDRMQVLTVPEQQPRYRGVPIENRCTDREPVG